MRKLKLSFFVFLFFLGIFFIHSSFVFAQETSNNIKSDFFARQMTPQYQKLRPFANSGNPQPPSGVKVIKRRVARPQGSRVVGKTPLKRGGVDKKVVKDSAKSASFDEKKEKKDVPYLSYKEKNAIGTPPEEIENLMHMKAIIDKRLNDPKYKAYIEKIKKDKDYKKDSQEYQKDIEIGKRRSGKGERYNKKIDKDIEKILNKL